MGVHDRLAVGGRSLANGTTGAGAPAPAAGFDRPADVPGPLRGTWYLVPTPFDEDGELDLASQGDVVDAAVGWGVDGLTVMGVMSEPTALTDAERTAALRAIFDAARGRVPVVVGCSAAGSTRAAAYARQARDLGAVAAMVAAPSLTRNVDLMPAFYAAVRREGGLPLLLQDEPAATGVLMHVSVLMACAAASGARAIKVEDPPTPTKIGRLHAMDATLALFGGLGGMAALSELRRGAAGTMTGFAYPEVMRAVRVEAEEERWDRAAAIFDRFLPLIVFEAQVAVGLAIRKEVLRRRGAIRSNVTRGITRRIDAESSAELDHILDRIGLTPSRDPLTSIAPVAG
jgi:4-hydroxy-tetrahydrodipicolinate synthase